MKYFKSEYWNDTNKGLSRILRAGIIGVVIIWISTFAVNYFFLFNTNQFNGGTLGDSFGMVNALFSALAFAFLIYTSLLQRKELELQREELIETRRELERSANSQSEIADLNREQLFLTIAYNHDNLPPTFRLIEHYREENYSRLIFKLYFKTVTKISFLNTYTQQIISKDVYQLDHRENTNPEETISVTFGYHLNEFIIRLVSDNGSVYHQKVYRVGEMCEIASPIKI